MTLSATPAKTQSAHTKIAHYRAAIQANPADVTLWVDLAFALTDAHDLVGAKDAFTQAVARGGDHIALNNLAATCLGLGQSDEAIRHAQAATVRAPQYALAQLTLARAHVARQNRPAAMGAFEATLRLDASMEDAWLGGADVLVNERRYAEAVQWLQRAAAALPNSAEVWTKAGAVMAEWGHTAQALAMYEQALRLEPHHLKARLGLALSMPIVPLNRDEIAAARQRASAALDQIEANIAQILAHPKSASPLEWSNFFLAYQGENDLGLQTRFARIHAQQLRQALPQFFEPIPTRAVKGRIRVGFVSRFFYSSTVGYYFKEWIVGLSRQSFEVHVFATHFVDDDVSREIGNAVHVMHRPYATLAATAEAIRGAALDVLIYPELGMDGRTFALAAMRLAPMQCMAWGHPITCGHENIDLAFTSDIMEPADGDAHWHESLIRLPGLGTCYRHPGLPESVGSRADFGLPDAAPLILYPQSLFKIHPDNDALVVAVLKAVPEAILVMFQGQTDVMTQRFVSRMSKAFAAAGVAPRGRIKLLPNVDHLDYLRINHLCDLMLDTLHWSGGNTSIDALASGLPIVTLPGRFMRGRQSAGMLTLLGLSHLVARDEADYVARAVELLRNPKPRRQNNLKRLFDDPAPVQALAKVLLDIVPGKTDA